MGLVEDFMSRDFCTIKEDKFLSGEHSILWSNFSIVIKPWYNK